MVYAGFWFRLYALLWDALIFLPISFVFAWGAGYSQYFELYFFVPWLLIVFFYNIYLVKRYGGTPGKLIAGIRISKLDGTDVGYKEAILRDSVAFVLFAIVYFLDAKLTSQIPDSQYFGMGWAEQGQYIIDNRTVLHANVDLCSYVWMFGEFIVMLTNDKRRAIHDFMAGTVVIHKDQPVETEQAS